MARLLLLLLRIAVVCAVVTLVVSDHGECVLNVWVNDGTCGQLTPVTDARFDFDTVRPTRVTYLGNEIYSVEFNCFSGLPNSIIVTAGGFEQMTITLNDLLLVMGSVIRLQCSDPSCYPYMTSLTLTSECNEPLGQFSTTIPWQGNVQSQGDSGTFVIGYCLPGQPITIRDGGRDVAYEILNTGSQSISIECSENAVANVANRVDGVWSMWGVPGVCSVTCGLGTRMRQRQCNSPPPQNGGRDCVGLSGEEVSCFLRACPTDGMWSPWLQWSNCDCSDVEGTGTQTRLRVCSNPAPSNGGAYCTGSADEKRSCADQIPRCPPLPVDGGWTAWGEWVCARERRAVDPVQNRFRRCVDPVAGDPAVAKTRFRACTNPAPAYGGAACPGIDMETVI